MPYSCTKFAQQVTWVTYSKESGECNFDIRHIIDQDIQIEMDFKSIRRWAFVGVFCPMWVILWVGMICLRVQEYSSKPRRGHTQYTEQQ